jgi:hypothetical protein
MIREGLVAYFVAEKRGAFLLLGMVLAALVVSAALVTTGSVYRAAAWPLVLVAVAELGIAVVLLQRTDKQTAELLDHLSRSPLDMARYELERMARVRRTFVIALTGEAVVLLGGCAVVISGIAKDDGLAIALGGMAQAALLLAFDLFAWARAAHYVKMLNATVRVYQ